MKPKKSILVLFVVILLLANTPYVGTDSPFSYECKCECPDLDGAKCDCSEHCYHTFKARKIFWFPWERIRWDFMLLDYAKIDGKYEFIVNNHSIPLLRGVNNILTYRSLDDIFGLLFNLIYFYIVSCLLIFIYKKIKFNK